MLTIPLPFIVSLLLIIVAMVVFKKQKKATQSPFIFIILCAICTAIVGLRWSFDITIIRFIQPIFASIIPIMAWQYFSKAHHLTQFSGWHWFGPILITCTSLLYPVIALPIDLILAIIYFFYAALLIRSSLSEPEEVRLANMQQVALAERGAGMMLLFSGCVDGAISLDFWLFEGESIPYILSFSYLLLIPAIVSAIIIVSMNTFQMDIEHNDLKNNNLDKNDINPTVTTKEASENAQLSQQEAQAIVDKVDNIINQQQLFLDLDLTLTRLSRKLSIPSRKISMAINQIYAKNVSKVINEYRIHYAKNLLITSEASITEVSLDSGFQTKSNFNREFSRITGKTPSAYRNENTHLYNK